MISKETFKNRLKFHADYARFTHRRKKPVTLEDIDVPVPDVTHIKHKTWTNQN